MEKGKKSVDKKIESVKTTVLAAIAIFGSGIVLTGYILGTYITEEAQPIVKRYQQSIAKKSEVVNVTRSVQYDRLKDFVETASLNSQAFDSLIGDLSKETFGLTEKQKFMLVYQALVKDLKKVSSNTLHDKYENERDYFLGDSDNGVFEISFDEFNKKYKYYFNEIADFDALSNYEYGNEETIGNPVLYKVDFELGKIYFSNYVKGNVSSDRYITKVFDYDEDDLFYFVYEYIAKYNENEGFYRAAVDEDELVDVDDFYGNETKFDTLVWKFDKDYNFVSTTYIR